jgi:hypothetical protein
VEANKEQLLIDKVSEIQRENRILLKKMLTIDLKPSKHNPQKIKMFPTPSAYSLNRAQRIRELTRVTQENKMLLQRLQTAHSVYDREKWAKDFKQKKYQQDLLRKNADRFCQHPYFVMSTEPRVMSATGMKKFGNCTMPLKGKRASSNFSAVRRGKSKKRRLFTAGHGGRKRSAVARFSQTNRPITAKGPGFSKRTSKTRGASRDHNLRPETVPFTNIGPLGETEPVDENDKILQEITREVTGESEKEIEARIGNEEVKEESESDHKLSREDKYGEKEKQLDNLTEDASNNQDKSEHENEEKPQSNTGEAPVHVTQQKTSIPEKPVKKHNVEDHVEPNNGDTRKERVAEKEGENISDGGSNSN